MVEIGALQSPVVAALPTPRPPESARSAERVTPPSDTDKPNPDGPNQSLLNQRIERQFHGRVGFTTLLGPDPETGLPLRVVRGSEYSAAARADLSQIIASRIANGGLSAPLVSPQPSEAGPAPEPATGASVSPPSQVTESSDTRPAAPDVSAAPGFPSGGGDTPPPRGSFLDLIA